MKIVIDQCPCGKAFVTSEARQKSGRGVYCDKKCFYAYRPRSAGLKYSAHTVNPTSYRPGNTPWNKGKRKGDA